MALTFLYWAFRRILEFVVLGFRSERAKEIKLIVLRHQLSVLKRQVARPKPLSRRSGSALGAQSAASPGPLAGLLCPPRDAPALASKARRPALDVSAPSPGTSRDRRGDPHARPPARPGEPHLRLSKNPWRTGRPGDFSRSEHDLDHPPSGGHATSAGARRAELDAIPPPASRRHPRL